MGSTDLSQLLRGFLGLVGGLGFVLGVAVIVAGEPVGGSWLLIGGAVLLLIALYEQARYRAHPWTASAARPTPASGPPWGGGSASAEGPGGGRGRYERTDEVFDDPTTGQRFRVWYDPVTGDRRYEPEP